MKGIIMTNAVQVLMRRDDLTKDEAQSVVDEAKECVLKAVEEGNFSEADNVWGDLTGLEPDYLEIELL